MRLSVSQPVLAPCSCFTSFLNFEYIFCMNGPFNHALQDHPQSRLRRLLLLHGIVVWTHLKSTALIKNIGPRTASLTQTFASFCTKAGSADDESQTHLRGRPGLLPVL